MFRIVKTVEISAAHSLRLPYDSPCNRDHGHNYVVEIEVQAEELNSVGMVADYTLLKLATHGWLDHQNVDDRFAKAGIEERSTTEVIALSLMDEVEGALKDPDSIDCPAEMGNPHAHCTRIKIYETSTSYTEVTA